MAFRNRSTEHPQHQTEFKIPRVQKHKTEFENNFPFLDRRTPAQSMSVTDAQRHLKKIRTVANWLDNAVPYSPIPIGLDTFVVCGSSWCLVVIMPMDGINDLIAVKLTLYFSTLS